MSEWQGSVQRKQGDGRAGAVWAVQRDRHPPTDGIRRLVRILATIGLGLIAGRSAGYRGDASAHRSEPADDISVRIIADYDPCSTALLDTVASLGSRSDAELLGFGTRIVRGPGIGYVGGGQFTPGRVLTFDSTGRRLRDVLGREGGGPGEFIAPRPTMGPVRRGLDRRPREPPDHGAGSAGPPGRGVPVHGAGRLWVSGLAWVIEEWKPLGLDDLARIDRIRDEVVEVIDPDRSQVIARRRFDDPWTREVHGNDLLMSVRQTADGCVFVDLLRPRLE